MNKDDLINLKEQIDQAKGNVSRLKGQKEILMKELKGTWGCTTVKQAEKIVSDMQKEIEELDKEIESGLDELKEKYEFED